MFEDAGKKLQNIAIVLFGMGTACAIIAGFAMIYDEMVLPGIITLIGGPSVAWLIALLVHAFAQLVDDANAIRNKLNSVSNHIQILAEPIIQEATGKTQTQVGEESNHPSEQKTTSNNTGKEFAPQFIEKKETNAPYWCGNCGHDGPYDGICPICNSSIKRYNV